MTRVLHQWFLAQARSKGAHDIQRSPKRNTVRWRLASQAHDRTQLKNWLLAEFLRYPPRVIVPRHGPPITDPAFLSRLLAIIKSMF